MPFQNQSNPREAYKLRREMHMLEKTQHQLRIHHFTATNSWLRESDEMLPRVTYWNNLFQDLPEELPEILRAAGDPSRNGRTLLVCSSDTHDQTDESMHCTVLVEQEVQKFITDPARDSDGRSLQNTTIYNITGDVARVFLDTKQTSKSLAHGPGRMVNFFHDPDGLMGSPPKKNGLDQFVSLLKNMKQFKFVSLDTSHVPVSIFTEYKNLVDQPWFTRFMDVPLCVGIKLVPTYGTCWWNAAANMMLLSEPIAALLRHVWVTRLTSRDRSEIEKFSLESCPADDVLKDKCLLFLINHILIKGQRAQPWQDNFSSHVAGGAKNSIHGSSEYPDLHELKKTSTIHYQDAGQVFLGMSVLMKDVLEFSDFKTIFLDTGLSYQTVVDMNATNSLTWDTSMWKKRARDIQKGTTTPHDNKESWNSNPHPIIVHVYTRDVANFCPLNIKVNNLEYDLEAGVIQLLIPDKTKHRHSIAGMTCRSRNTPVRYIYDSNKYLARDDWTHLRYIREPNQSPSRLEVARTSDGMQNYLAIAKDAFGKDVVPQFKGFEFLTYILRPQP